MNEKQLYQQRGQAQIDEWKAELLKFKAKASAASAGAQLQLLAQIKLLEGKVEEGKAKLAEAAEASDAAWESIKVGGESAWASLRTAFRDAASKFRE